MKNIKLIHVGMALVLFLLSLAILEWATLPKKVPASSAGSSIKIDQSEALPTLPQNEPSPPIAVPVTENELFLFEGDSFKNNDEPKDPAINQKPEL
jgi:hypothetical protein